MTQPPGDAAGLGRHVVDFLQRAFDKQVADAEQRRRDLEDEWLHDPERGYHGGFIDGKGWDEP